jgi:hypothetical protein
MKQLISRIRVVTGFLVLVVVLTLVAWSTSQMTISAAPPPGPVAAPVIVTNTPLPVTTGPERHRFQYRFPSCFIDLGDGGCSVTYDVPAGKLLVIETISVGETLPAGQKPFALLYAYTDGLYNPFILPQSFIFTDTNPSDHYGATHTPRVYADPGTTITVFLQRDQTTGGGIGAATISGYLFDCASAATCALP